MYRRLDYVRNRLSEIGLRHDTNQSLLISRYAGDRASEQAKAALSQLLTMIEPVKGYERSRQQPLMNQYIPLTGLADCARPDSPLTREFGKAVSMFIETGDSDPLSACLTAFAEIASGIDAHLDAFGPRQTELAALASQISDLSDMGFLLLEDGEAVSPEALRKDLEGILTPRAAVDIPAAKEMQRLVDHFAKAEVGA